MLQKYYEQGQGQQEQEQACVSLWARIRTYIYTRVGKLESCELEAESWLDEVKSYKLWIEVMEISGKRWTKEFTTARQMKEAIKELNREYVTCNEIYGEHDGMGKSWMTHYGKIFDKE